MTNKFPRLRSHVRRRKDGSVVAYYFYDMRHEGKPDVPLGKDYDAAVEAVKATNVPANFATAKQALIDKINAIKNLP